MRRRWVLCLGSAVVALGGCATLPTGPSVTVLPAPGKSFEQFQAEDAVCRQWATQRVGGQPGATVAEDTAVEAQRRYDTAYQQCMYAKGNQIPGAVRGPRPPAMPPPPLPPPPGYSPTPPGLPPSPAGSPPPPPAP